MKRCYLCNNEKNEDEFCKDRRMPDGKERRCKSCRSTAEKERRKKPEVKAKQREYAKSRRLDPEFISRWSEYYRQYIKRPYVKERYKSYKKKNPKYKEKQCAYARKRNTGWTEDAFLRAWGEQSGLCAICQQMMERTPGKNRSAVGDHCHSTKKTRAILCNECNLKLGILEKNIDRLEEFFNYIKHWQNRFRTQDSGI